MQGSYYLALNDVADHNNIKLLLVCIEFDCQENSHLLCYIIYEGFCYQCTNFLYNIRKGSPLDGPLPQYYRIIKILLGCGGWHAHLQKSTIVCMAIIIISITIMVLQLLLYNTNLPNYHYNKSISQQFPIILQTLHFVIQFKSTLL